MQMVSTGILLCSLQYTISSSAYNQLALHPVIETCFAQHTISIIGKSCNMMSAVQNIYVSNFSYFYHFYNSILVDCRAKNAWRYIFVSFTLIALFTVWHSYRCIAWVFEIAVLIQDTLRKNVLKEPLPDVKEINIHPAEKNNNTIFWWAILQCVG